MTEADAGAPHYLGHRERLRERFRKGGADALGEYELLELILFAPCHAVTSSRSPKPSSRDLAPLPKRA